ncbi:MAG: hypothetical protein EHM43_03745 [Ignavibacteriae bacterium]|nr:MAG: hypothetical protein EHM43_03745 [Ignavibacteriota bacterium]
MKKLLSTSDPYVPLQAILANEHIHPAYRAFFGAEVAWWVHEERAIRNSNPRFDTNESHIRELSAKLDEAYVRSARFDHEELTATIDAAVKTRLNFLVRPRTSLKWFVFRGEPTKPLHEIVLRLSYLYDHAYLTEGIRTWARSRGADGAPSYEILSIVEFERIVEKVDNDAILDLSQDEFVRLLNPIFTFFAENNPDLPPESVPTESVIIFMDDKGAIPISQALERLLYREDMRLLTRSKFLDVIDQVIEEIEQPTASQPVTSQPATSQPATSESATPEAADLEVADLAVADLEVADVEVASTLESAYELRYQRYLRETDADGRAKFLAKLFGGESVAMETLIGEVLGSETWKIAAARLDKFFIRKGIEVNSAVAMEFAHALNRAFR